MIPRNYNVCKYLIYSLFWNIQILKHITVFFLSMNYSLCYNKLTPYFVIINLPP